MFARQFAINMMRRAARWRRPGRPRRQFHGERLARALLILASLDADSDAPRVLQHMTEARLAAMLAADPARIGDLMQKFRQAGHLGPGEPLTVHSSLAMVPSPATPREAPNQSTRARADPLSRLIWAPHCHPEGGGAQSRDLLKPFFSGPSKAPRCARRGWTGRTKSGILSDDPAHPPDELFDAARLVDEIDGARGHRRPFVLPMRPSGQESDG